MSSAPSKTPPSAVFRADASVGIGGGHVRRCLVLARALMRDGWSVRFASSGGTLDTVPALRTAPMAMIEAGPTPGDTVVAMRAALPSGSELLVVDHYGLDSSFERACRGWAKRILVIDDLADRSHDCDVLLDQTPGRRPGDYRTLVPAHCRILAGPDYALLDERFAVARERLPRREGHPRRMLVSLGATDPTGATLLVISALQRADPGIAVDVVIGAASPFREEIKAAAARLTPSATVQVEVDDMAALIGQQDFAIGAGGVSALERCCLGVPSVVIVLAENQRGNAEAMATAGAATIVDEAGLRDTERFAALVRKLVHDPAGLAAMRGAALDIVDGQGVSRVLEHCRTDKSPTVTRRDG